MDGVAVIAPVRLVKRLAWTLDKPKERLPFVWRLSGAKLTPCKQWELHNRMGDLRAQFKRKFEARK